MPGWSPVPPRRRRRSQTGVQLRRSTRRRRRCSLVVRKELALEPWDEGRRTAWRVPVWQSPYAAGPAIAPWMKAREERRAKLSLSLVKCMLGGDRDGGAAGAGTERRRDRRQLYITETSSKCNLSGEVEKSRKSKNVLDWEGRVPYTATYQRRGLVCTWSNSQSRKDKRCRVRFQVCKTPM